MPSVEENPEISLRDVQAAFKGLLKSGGPITMGAEIAAVFASTLMMPLERLIDAESEKILEAERVRGKPDFQDALRFLVRVAIFELLEESLREAGAGLGDSAAKSHKLLQQAIDLAGKKKQNG